MCIAIYSLPDNPIPTDETLKICFQNNSDGAGFAFNMDNHQVQIIKGFMTYEKFIKAFHEYNRKYSFKDRGVLIHFRITTHGGTNQGCCHPFPLSDSDDLLKKTKVTSSFALIHNGVISLTSNEADKKTKMSDTMVFIQKYLSMIASNKHWFKNVKNFELIENLISSKMAILNGYGEIHSTSGFHKGEDGNFYSNDSYKDNYGLQTYGFYDLYENMFDVYSKDYNEGSIPLMKLHKNEMIYFDDGHIEEYDKDYHEAYPTYINESGEVYTCFDENNSEFCISMSDLSYVGSGCFVDSKNPMCENDILNIVPFREDIFAYIQ